MATNFTPLDPGQWLKSAATSVRAAAPAAPPPSPSNPSSPAPPRKSAPASSGFTPLTSAGAGGGNHQPQISVQREGDRITLIRVQCACGQIIELACHY